MIGKLRAEPSVSDVLGPPLVRVSRVDAQADDFYAPAIELRFEPGTLAKFGSAYGSKVFGCEKARPSYRRSIHES